MRVIAFDPGAVSGAYAVIDTDPATGWLEVGDLPSVKGELHYGELARLLSRADASVAVLERVSAMPKQGVRSVWVFGQAVGAIKMAIAGAGLRQEPVTPVTWKKFFKLPGKDKEAARLKAMQLYPQVSGLARKKDHGRAEALLIAHWYLATTNAL